MIPIFDHDNLRQEMSAKDIAIMNDVLLIAEARKLVMEGPDVQLPEPPDRIVDRFKSVLGDNFHYAHRIVVPVKHEMKKAFYVAQMEAFFAWDPVVLENAKKALRRQEKMSDDDISTMMYYNPAYFKKAVPRRVLPPSMLYWRVRAVYATYGPVRDATTGKPLFNDAAWKKAKRVLEEILAGHVSDPPGESFYSQKLDCYGEAVSNKHGLPVYSCERGTNSTENYHKQLLTSIGTWSAGTEIADTLRNEHRHRYNQSVSEQKRFGYPQIGHADTWLIDLLQMLVEENHDVLLYPFWSNTCDFLDTNETFGTIPLQSAELTAAVNQLQTDTEKLTCEQKYLAKRQGVKVCFTPVVFAAEKVLFNRFLLLFPTPINFEALSMAWVKEVNCKTIFPKLPVYLRNYYEEWRRNQLIKEAVRRAATKKNALIEFNKRLVPSAQFQQEPLIRTAPATTNDVSDNNIFAVSGSFDDGPMQSQQGLVTATVPTTTAVMGNNIVATSDGFDDGPTMADCKADTLDDGRICEWPEPVPPPTMPQAFRNLIAPRPMHIVGGTWIGIVPAPTVVSNSRKQGQRGPDQKMRQPRKCKRCSKFGKATAIKCRGRTRRGETECEYFTENGDSIFVGSQL